MADKIQDLTGDAREQRIAELKRKMQESAKKAKAAQDEGSDAPSGGITAGQPAAPAAQPAPAAATTAAATAIAQPAESVAAVADTGATNGATPPAQARPAAPIRPAAPKPQPKAEEVLTSAEMNRREFLTYAWGAALGLLTLESGVASFMFMYPRFKAGEFGGEFYVSRGEIPDPSAEPQPNATGKFWLISTEEGEPKALYMVCTHLGCLYKWEPSNSRFECPCHGSKFTHDGFYIEGPAPRSLDYFEIADGPTPDEIAVDTGAKVSGGPATESPARVVPL